MTEFNSFAPSAPAVFYRSYSRRKEDGTRESFSEAIMRTISAIAEIGSFTESQKEMALDMGLKQHCFPSGRALWVAGTEWAKKPDNFPGYYNCCSMHVDDISIFGLLMELAMMGTGTGAVLESHVVDKLPPIRRSLFITDIINNQGVKGGLSDTSIQFTGIVDNNPAILVRVGDSREGWAAACQGLIKLAMGASASDEDETTTCVDALITLDLSQVRQAGEPLKGFGGTANPVRLQESMERAAMILSRAVGRKLTPIECCLLIDEASSAVVAGNIRRSAGMRQFSADDIEAAMAKDGLYKQDADGNWSVDPDKEALRMANHTRCFHTKPEYEEIQHAVTKQFWSGEGAIMYVPESVARANADLLNTEELKQRFLRAYADGRENAREMLVELAEKAGEPTDDRIIEHRMDRYGLNPCFAPGTIVMTKQGYFPIEELVGKTVEVHDGNEWRTIDNFRVTAYDQDVYNVTLHDGTVITATEYHKFILKDGRRIELKDLQIGDELMPAQATPAEGNVSVKGAYLKGFLIGDGTAYKGAPICKIYGPKKVCTQKLYAAQEEIGLVERRAKNGITVGVEPGLTKTDYLRNLTALKENLHDWGSTYKKQFPYETLNWTNKCKAEFIAGLFDADGTLRDTKENGFSYQLTSVHKEFLVGMVMLLRSIGIGSKIGPQRAGGLKDFGPERGGVYRVKPTYRLALTQQDSIKLSRLVSFKRLKSVADRKTVYVKKLNYNMVKSIEYAYKAPEVYCCTVPGTSAFTIGSLILVGNCGEILLRDNLCNLSEVHLNTIDPSDKDLQHKAFYTGGLQVAALLQHKFTPERLRYSRENDPIVGVSFTGLFDFFVHAFGAPWLKWMMKGRPSGNDYKKYQDKEQKFLENWRLSAEQGVRDYCKQHNIRLPNRFTTVQPAGSKSLLTGASPGWHPPKAQRFIRRITFGVNDPLVSALRDYGYSVIPAQSARDELGNLLDDITDPRVQEVLVEIPTEVSWANLPGCDEFDLSKLPIEAQWGLYIQVQNYYTTHNTSATLEFRENEIERLSHLIYDNIKSDNGYISAALLARFDANETFPRLPFEPITKQTYDRRMAAVIASRSVLNPNTTILDLLNKYDNPEYELKGAAGCDSAKCLSESEKDRDQLGKL
jgi:ribonucleotide reductase class II